MWVWIYNLLLFTALIPALPLIILKSITNRRLRYKLLERFIPKQINIKDYILIHTSSFGEAKAIAKYSEYLKKLTNKEIVHTVFTDTAYKFLKNNHVHLMPIDLWMLYKKLFKKLPKLAIFFETEIWPSYISYLKKQNIPLVLINARMSSTSFKKYKKLPFLFGKTIAKFDLIIAKSKEDAEKFYYFNKKVIVCGNIKNYKEKQIFENVKEKLKIKTDKPILTLASFHKEEIDLSVNIIDKFRKDYFIVLAPRHMEDIPAFEARLKSNNISYIKRSSNKQTTETLLLDTMGELEKIYSISKVAILGGSFHPNLKGHNPIEPLLYNNITLIGPYVESFKEEVSSLKKRGLIYQLEKPNYLPEIEKVLNIEQRINSSLYFKNLQFILNCYLIHTIKILKKN